MIKAKELRIGNYIFDDDGIISKIIGFKPFDHSIRCDEDEGCNILIDIYPQDGSIRSGYESDLCYAKGIPLTEEWLIRFGFTKHFDEYEQETFFNLHGIMNLLSYNNGTYSFDFGASSTTCLIHNVHQIQNLIFILTGKELTLKPHKIVSL